jgi:hypothetical protein
LILIVQILSVPKPASYVTYFISKEEFKTGDHSTAIPTYKNYYPYRLPEVRNTDFVILLLVMSR